MKTRMNRTKRNLTSVDLRTSRSVSYCFNYYTTVNCVCGVPLALLNSSNWSEILVKTEFLPMMYTNRYSICVFHLCMPLMCNGKWERIRMLHRQSEHKYVILIRNHSSRMHTTHLPTVHVVVATTRCQYCNGDGYLRSDV